MSDATSGSEGIDAAGDQAAPLTTRARKERALHLITIGYGIAAIARELKVDRRTIFRWLQKDLKFRAAIREWREEATVSAANRMLAISEAAITVVGRAIYEGDRHMAMGLLKKLDLGQLPKNSLGEDIVLVVRKIDRRPVRPGTENYLPPPEPSAMEGLDAIRGPDIVWPPVEERERGR